MAYKAACLPCRRAEGETQNWGRTREWEFLHGSSGRLKREKLAESKIGMEGKPQQGGL